MNWRANYAYTIRFQRAIYGSMFVYRLGANGLEPCVDPELEQEYLPPDPTDLPWVAAAFAEEGRPYMHIAASS
ncbi:MAG: hypothetical protein AB7S38_34315 [Vulcanimicrobiota bacterium]